MKALGVSLSRLMFLLHLILGSFLYAWVILTCASHCLYQVNCGRFLRLPSSVFLQRGIHCLCRRQASTTFKSPPAFRSPSWEYKIWPQICMRACLIASSLHPTLSFLSLSCSSFVFSCFLLLFPPLSRAGLLLIHLCHVRQVLFGVMATRFPILWVAGLSSPSQHTVFNSTLNNMAYCAQFL